VSLFRWLLYTSTTIPCLVLYRSAFNFVQSLKLRPTHVPHFRFRIATRTISFSLMIAVPVASFLLALVALLVGWCTGWYWWTLVIGTGAMMLWSYGTFMYAVCIETQWSPRQRNTNGLLQWQAIFAILLTHLSLAKTGHSLHAAVATGHYAELLMDVAIAMYCCGLPTPLRWYRLRDISTDAASAVDGQILDDRSPKFQLASWSWLVCIGLSVGTSLWCRLMVNTPQAAAVSSSALTSAIELLPSAIALFLLALWPLWCQTWPVFRVACLPCLACPRRVFIAFWFICAAIHIPLAHTGMLDSPVSLLSWLGGVSPALYLIAQLPAFRPTPAAGEAGAAYRAMDEPDGPPILIPITVVTADDVNVAKYPTCPICTEDFMPGEANKVLPCGHPFHAICIDQWLSQKAQCPSCRANLSP